MSAANTYEKLGAFYLGRTFNARQGEVTDELLLYDAKDLTTHAVCVGMTGSGKTGLGVTLLEEAAIDGIPALIIDPKGDMGNLMLTFPELRPEDFRPWVDPAEARRKAMDPDEYAANRADLWRTGLKSWDQDGARIQRLRDAAEVAIYTPGGTGGLPLTVLRSFDAPPEPVRDDPEALGDRINAAVSGLLTLLDIDPDPVRSREHILLSTILHRSWTKGESLDLATLIQRIQRPGIERLGVLDLESFFPSSERFGLAMLVNNLLASPGFAAWTQGEPLDIDRLLYTAEGKPRLAVLSLGHLDDKERMFFVTTLLNELVTWMRSQSGTSSLRALLYMDEIFGYFPPTANPPSKRPMLTLLKQARAYGLGVVLCTQNPVDLDYKGLSNTGTWFIGRLQTERDKLRVLDGLEGASTAAGHRFDRGAMEALISGLDSRVFLLNNVHEDAPVLFHTRWALSYLSGPMTRAQIRRLMDDHPVEAIATGPASGTTGTTRSVPRAAAPAPAPGPDDDLLPGPPTLPTSVEQTYVSARDQPQGTLVYRPALLGRVRLHYVRTSANVDHWDDLGLITTELDAHDPWAEADALAPNALRMDASPRDGRFAPLPNGATKATHFKSFERALKEHAYRERPLTLLQAPALKEWAKPEEDERAFRIRLRDEVRDRRDLEVEKLRDRFGKKLKTLEDRKRRAEDKVEREKAQLKQSGLSTAVSVGATLLGALLGRKKLSVGNVSRAGTAVRGASRTVNERSDVARAEEALEVADERLLELSSELEQEIDEVKERWDPETLEIESIVLRPRKGDLQIEALSVAWLPHERRGDDLIPLVDWDEA